MPGTSDLVTAYKKLCDARLEAEFADKMYRGGLDEVFSSENVRRLLAKFKVDDIKDLCYAHIPVDTVANRLHLQSLTVSQLGSSTQDDATSAADEGDEDETEDDVDQLDAAQAALDRTLKRNQFNAESDGLHERVSKHGDCYLLVWPVTEREEEQNRDDEQDGVRLGDTTPPDPGRVVEVDIRVNSAHTVLMIYDAEDPLRIAYVIKAWSYDVVEERREVHYTRANLYYRDRIERWVSLPDRKDDSLTEPTSWDLYSEGKDRESTIPNPYGRIPWFHFRNDRPYGQPEHWYAYGPQQILSKLVRSHVASIDYQNFPQRYAIMDPKSDDVLGNFIDPDRPEDDDDDPEGEGNTSALRADPAVVWRLRGAKSVGQFDPASPDAFLAPLDRYVQAMGELTETPLYRFGSKFATTPSGEALRQADAPTIAKVENRQDRYGPEWEDAAEFVLELLGFTGATVEAQWRPSAPATDGEFWTAANTKQEAGVPARQTLLEAGYAVDDVDRWLPGEDEQDLNRRIGMLDRIGEAAQKLGGAVALELLSRETAELVLARVIGPALEDPDQPSTEDILALVPARQADVDFGLAGDDADDELVGAEV